MPTVPTPADSGVDPFEELRTADPATFGHLLDMARAHLAAEPKAFAEAYLRASMTPQDARQVLDAIVDAVELHRVAIECCKVLTRLMDTGPDVPMSGEQALAIWEATGVTALQDILLSAAAHISDATGSEGPQRSPETVREIGASVSTSPLGRLAGGAA